MAHKSIVEVKGWKCEVIHQNMEVSDKLIVVTQKYPLTSNSRHPRTKGVGFRVFFMSCFLGFRPVNNSAFLGV